MKTLLKKLVQRTLILGISLLLSFSFVYGRAHPRIAVDADDVRVVDTLGYYTGTDAEAIFEELGNFSQYLSSDTYFVIVSTNFKVLGYLNVTGSMTVAGISKFSDVGINDSSPDAQLEILSDSSPTEYVVLVSSQNDTTSFFKIRGDGVSIFDKAPRFELGASMIAGNMSMRDASPVVFGTNNDMYIAWEEASDILVIGTGSTIGANQVIEIDGSSVTIKQDLYVDTAKDFIISEGKLADSVIVSADIKDGVVTEADLNVSNSPTDNYLLSYNQTGTNFTWVVSPSGGGGGDSTLQVMVDNVEITSPTASIDFENVFTGVAVGTKSHVFISTAAPSNGDTTHLANCDQIYDFVSGNYESTVTEGSLTDQVILGADIKDDTIDSANYAAASIDNEHLADDAVDSAEIATNAVKVDALDITDVSDNIAGDIAEGELADSCIVSADIKDGVVALVDMTAAATGYGTNWNNAANVSVTGAQILDDTVDSADYAANSIDREHIQNDIDPGTDFAVCISSPAELGSGATLISVFRDYAVTITTISAQIIGGTNYVMMIEQRTIAGIESAGTDIWGADLTVLPTNWTGLAASDFTVPANSALVLVPTSFSGDVGRIFIKGRFTVD